MSASPSRALDAIAFQLVAALERYDRDTERMIAAWPRPELYREIFEQMENIRMYSAALAQVRVQSVELLIAHAELVHCLWRAQFAGPREARERIAAEGERHERAVAALRKRCLRVLKDCETPLWN
jgi:hypothetical protein